MNCKPGDIAYLTQDLFIECRGSGEKALLVRRGTIVSVERLGGPAWWLIATPIPYSLKLRCGCVALGTIAGFDDCLLRPLRGDGLTQQEVDQLYAPVRVPEEA